MVTVTSLDTVKVVGVECLSKYCNYCRGKEIFHHLGCLANYAGSSGAMEINGVDKIYDCSNTANSPAHYMN